MKDRKAAVEMSLNLIIMLIIGIVVLGLVIGFVNNLVNQGKETYTAQLNDNEKLKLEEVDRCPDNLCVIPDPSVTVRIGERENIFVKVRAFTTTDISCGAGPIQGCQLTYSVVDDQGADATNQFTLAGPGFSASGGASDSKMYSLNADGTSVSTGVYYMTLNLYTGPDQVTKTLTINVE